MLSLDQLIVVAAPSCCGKSTFINGLQNCENEPIRKELKLSNPESWSYADAFYVDEQFLRQAENDSSRSMILHWTIPRPSLRLAARKMLNGFSYEKKARVKLLESAREKVILTLYCRQESLLRGVHFRRKRAYDRYQSGSSGRMTYLRQNWNMRMLDRLYSDMTKVAPIYDRWFEFCASLSTHKSYLVDLDNPNELIPIDHWPRIRRAWVDGR